MRMSVHTDILIPFYSSFDYFFGIVTMKLAPPRANDLR